MRREKVWKQKSSRSAQQPPVHWPNMDGRIIAPHHQEASDEERAHQELSEALKANDERILLETEDQYEREDERLLAGSGVQETHKELDGLMRQKAKGNQELGCTWTPQGLCDGPGGTCGDGHLEKKCCSPGPAGGTSCGWQIELERCKVNDRECPINCEFGEWGYWMQQGDYGNNTMGDCPECGGGWLERTRKIRSDAQYGGAPCLPPFVQYKACEHTPPCEIDCEFGPWSIWTQCSVSCGPGWRNRFRERIHQAYYGGIECAGSAHERENCTLLAKHCPIDCSVGYWTPWSKCDMDCGGGKTSRTRPAIVEDRYGGAVCPHKEEHSVCNVDACPEEEFKAGTVRTTSFVGSLLLLVLSTLYAEVDVH